MELGQSWKNRAGKPAIMYDLVQIIKSQDLSKTVFCMAGANQDATSTRRCDLSQDPSAHATEPCLEMV
jgi:hypothetical protein